MKVTSQLDLFAPITVARCVESHWVHGWWFIENEQGFRLGGNKGGWTNLRRCKQQVRRMNRKLKIKEK
jgi:hypothetical protein